METLQRDDTKGILQKVLESYVAPGRKFEEQDQRVILQLGQQHAHGPYNKRRQESSMLFVGKSRDRGMTWKLWMGLGWLCLQCMIWRTFCTFSIFILPPTIQNWNVVPWGCLFVFPTSQHHKKEDATKYCDRKHCEPVGFKICLSNAASS